MSVCAAAGAASAHENTSAAAARAGIERAFMAVLLTVVGLAAEVAAIGGRQRFVVAAGPPITEREHLNGDDLAGLQRVLADPLLDHVLDVRHLNPVRHDLAA